MTLKHMKMMAATKALDAKSGTFVGLAAAYSLDLQGDFIQPGAFKQTLKEAQARKTASGSPYLYPLLWRHDPNVVLGGITSAQESADGLRVVGQIDLSTKLGQAAYSGIEVGYISGMSIGYRAVKASPNMQGGRLVQEIALGEISLTTLNYQSNLDAIVDRTSLDLPEEKSSMNRRNQDDVSSQRVPLAPYRHPETPQVPDVPEKPDRFAYFGDKQRYAEALKRWEQDVDDWHAASQKASGMLSPAEFNRAADQAERDTELARVADERARLPGASASELAAYYQRHGRTPDGRTIEDTSEVIKRAYEALMQKIAEEGR